MQTAHSTPADISKCKGTGAGQTIDGLAALRISAHAAEGVPEAQMAWRGTNVNGGGGKLPVCDVACIR
ncbi:hypothetical protein G0Q02_17380 [Epibacterium mobile]|nr:hypothetical protein [Tritonibacter mobilis]NHM24634.1 hypothetical protein [Tritonibacter mobilis]